MLDNIELAFDELHFSNLPLLWLVCSALVMLTADERPVWDGSGTALVAPEVVGDHLPCEL